MNLALPTHEALTKLELAARRGKLGGFQRDGKGGVLFTVRDFGGPFESVLEARDVQGTLHFRTRLRPTLVWVYLAVLVLSVWPGVWLTDSMLRTYFTGYHYQTWMWYLPLTVPFVPWGLWSAVRKSRQRAAAEVGPIVNSIASALAA